MMTKQELDLQNQRLNAARDAALADIRKERDIDERAHNRALCKLTLAAISDAAKLELKELLTEGHYQREQWRKDREDRIRKEHDAAKTAVMERYTAIDNARRREQPTPVRYVYDE